MKPAVVDGGRPATAAGIVAPRSAGRSEAKGAASGSQRRPSGPPAGGLGMTMDQRRQQASRPTTPHTARISRILSSPLSVSGVDWASKRLEALFQPNAPLAAPTPRIGVSPVRRSRRSRLATASHGHGQASATSHGREGAAPPVAGNKPEADFSAGPSRRGYRDTGMRGMSSVTVPTRALHTHGCGATWAYGVDLRWAAGQLKLDVVSGGAREWTGGGGKLRMGGGAGCTGVRMGGVRCATSCVSHATQGVTSAHAACVNGGSFSGR
jgi:hypothetical protein